ncbi:MAG TPA: hypothetical protein VKY31_09270 [Terriglobia bacterium]|nr:hypothetical protein [Terriglobia bacterium]
MKKTVRVIRIGLTVGFLLVAALGYGQARGQRGPAAPEFKPTVTPYDKLPDWSGAWTMMGGTVFDRGTQTGQGGSITPGVREHPPYNAEWEANYQKSLALRDKGLLPDVFTNWRSGGLSTHVQSARSLRVRNPAGRVLDSC